MVRLGLGSAEPLAGLAAYFVSLALLSLVLTRDEHELLFGVGVFILTGVLIAICWYKGEPPGWRWGGDDPLP